MSKGVPRPLGPVLRAAQFIAGELAVWSEKIEIAGSLRRRRPMVGDIDLVILPQDRRAIIERLKKKCVIQSGEAATAQNVVAIMPDGLEINIFFARPASGDFFAPVPGNWGSLLLCRTGSRVHNIALCRRAQGMGLHYDPYRGVLKGGQVIASDSEEEIYAALKLRFLCPESEREDIEA